MLELPVLIRSPLSQLQTIKIQVQMQNKLSLSIFPGISLIWTSVQCATG